MAIIILPLVEIMLSLNNSQDIAINIKGANNKTSGRDLYDYSNTIIFTEKKCESSIEKVLKEIYNIPIDIEYEKPDTEAYKIENKIEYNKLSKYKYFFDDYMENYDNVRRKIKLTVDEGDIIFEKRLLAYIKSKYIKHCTKQKNGDSILDLLIKEIEQELKEYSSLTLDDISAVHFVVFYAFAECKIFDKPPKSDN